MKIDHNSQCDETHPTCVNCSTSKLRCSFSRAIPTLPSTIPSTQAGTPGVKLSSDAPSPASYPSDSTGSSPAMSFQHDGMSSTGSSLPKETRQESTPNLANERYSLVHLELVHHFRGQLGKTMGFGQGEIEPMIEWTVNEAFKHPFLMDEIIALAASHRSSLLPTDQGGYYRTEATRLQTRALAEFNNAVRGDVSEDNGIAVFLFSTFLGQHVLFDTFSSLPDSPSGDGLIALLDKFIPCLTLQRGIAFMSSRCWPELEPRIEAFFGGHDEKCRLGPPDDIDPNGNDECAGLVRLLQSDYMATAVAGDGGHTHNNLDLDSSSRKACHTAALELQHMLNSQKRIEYKQQVTASQDPSPTTNNRRFMVIQEWPVRIPTEYINVLSKRQPEALAILAHYAVLIHRARDFWVLGRPEASADDAGTFLIRSINEYLGPAWASWMEWPNQVLLETQGVDV